MPFIVSAGTIVTGFGPGIISVSISIQPQIQRLYQLGTPVPYDRNTTTQKQMNISRYGGTGISYDLAPSAGCVEPDPIEISVVNPGCTDPFSDLDDWFISSYSYSKDVQGWGVEQYTLVSRPTVAGGSLSPTMIRGVAEGQRTSNGGADTGIVFTADNVIITGQTIDSPGGNPGIGTSFEIEYGEVQSVGNGTGKLDGASGNGNVSVPYIPIYL